MDKSKFGEYIDKMSMKVMAKKVVNYKIRFLLLKISFKNDENCKFVMESLEDMLLLLDHNTVYPLHFLFHPIKIGIKLQ